MKRLNLIVILIFIFAFFGFGQTNEIKSVEIKIAVIDTIFFYDKELGIPQFIQAYDMLDAEFKPQLDEIEVLNKKSREIKAEIDAIISKCNNGVIDCSRTIKNKTDESNKLDDEIKRKREVAKPQYEKRRKEIIDPINENIKLVLKLFAEQNGYKIILDKKMLNDSSTIINHTDNLDDITAEFIKFYNNYSLTNKPQ